MVVITEVFVGDRRRVIEQSCVISSFYLMESLAITACGDGAILLLTGIIQILFLTVVLSDPQVIISLVAYKDTHFSVYNSKMLRKNLSTEGTDHRNLDGF